MYVEAISFNLYIAGLVHVMGGGGKVKGRKGEREGGVGDGERRGGDQCW